MTTNREAQIAAVEWCVEYTRSSVNADEPEYKNIENARAFLQTLREGEAVGYVSEDAIRGLESARQYAKDPHRIGQNIVAGPDETRAVAIYLHPAPRQTEGWQCVPKEVMDFIYGEAPLDDVWFGERHPRISGSFWWRSFIRRMLAAAPAQPGGWQLVPHEPTREMLDAQYVGVGVGRDLARRCYQEMLNAYERKRLHDAACVGLPPAPTEPA